MERAYLGGSGLRVTRVILGCGNFGGIGSAPEFFGGGETQEEAFALMDAAWEAGIRTFDTADAYGGGRSETWIGDWLRTKGADVRDELVLSTKTFNPMDEGADSGLAPGRVRRQLDSSLERLGVDAVDLYLAHAPDPETPVEETFDAFEELARAGKVRAYGVSNVGAEELEAALAAGTPALVQNSFSLLDRGDEAGVIPLCSERTIPYQLFGPLAGGWLTGKYRRGAPLPAGSRMTMRPEPYARFDSEPVYRALDALEAAAQQRGVSMAGLALAWLLSHPGVTSIVVGPRTPQHLEPVREALALELRPEEHEEVGSLFD
jgi:aryl-alcohol dehydrogenase-like predicted oxidoreductase